jgi:dehydrogenase/reductase SDR family member 7
MCIILGCSQHSLAEETSADVADAMLRLNTLAPIALTRAALPVTALPVVASLLPSRRAVITHRADPAVVPPTKVPCQLTLLMAAQAMLKRRQGRILVISSMAGRIPSPGQALYSAAKFGLNGYFQALSTEICDR